MDCHEVRLRFSELTLAAGDAEQPGDLESVRRHLELCQECAQVFQAERLLDRTLTRLIQAVEIPAELENRLVQRCTTIPPTAAAQPRMGRSAVRRRWNMTAAALVMTVACLGLFAWLSRPPKLTLAQLETLVERADSTAAGTTMDMRDRPAGWQQVSGVQEQSTQQVETVDLVTFWWRPRGTSNASPGRLWIVSASRMAGGDSLPDLSTAEIQYRQKTTHLVWQEAGMVYLLELGDDVSGLRQLYEALRLARGVA